MIYYKLFLQIVSVTYLIVGETWGSNRLIGTAPGVDDNVTNCGGDFLLMDPGVMI